MTRTPRPARALPPRPEPSTHKAHKLWPCPAPSGAEGRPRQRPHWRTKRKGGGAEARRPVSAAERRGAGCPPPILPSILTGEGQDADTSAGTHPVFAGSPGTVTHCSVGWEKTTAQGEGKVPLGVVPLPPRGAGWLRASASFALAPHPSHTPVVRPRQAVNMPARNGGMRGRGGGEHPPTLPVPQARRP